MVRVGGSGKDNLVASITVIDSIGIAGAVARLTIDVDVCAVDCESSLVVVEFSRLPGGRGVASNAIMAEVSRDMVGIVRSGEACAVARETIRGRADVAGAVAALAFKRSMGAGEREIRSIVIKACRLPGI